MTLALRHTGLASAVALRDHRVVDISNRYGVAGDFDFANIAVWNSAIFQRIPPRKKISFIPIIADWINQGGRIGGIALDDGNWFNIGSRKEYLDVHRMISNKDWRPGYVKTRDWPQRVASSAIVDSSAQLRGCTVVGQNCRVGAEAILKDTILLPMQKLLPKAGWRHVLSAPEKRSLSSIATLTSEFMQNGPACSTHAKAFPALGCRGVKNRTDSKRWVRAGISMESVALRNTRSFW